VLKEKFPYPPMIENLPDIDTNLPGVRGKLFQGPTMQAVFFEVRETGSIPPHHHEAQWGVILEGEADLTIDGMTQRYQQGDSYYIPAGLVHSTQVRSPMKALEFFNEPARYRPKPFK